MNRINNSAKRAAVCGILAAMSMVLLYVGSISVLDLSAVVICAVVTMIVKVEMGGSVYPWLYVAVTGVLPFCFCPPKSLRWNIF